MTMKPERFALVWVLLAAVGCASSHHPVKVNTRAAERPAIACGSAIRGAETLLEPGTILFIGEMHGTAEIPAATAALVCQAARRGHPVQLGLEIPHEEEAGVARFLASAGTTADRADLLQGEFWGRGFQDGRSGQAMLALLDRMRVLKGAGLPIELTLLDSVDSNDRDQAMAGRALEAAKRSPQALFIILAGNVHARVVQGAPWNAELRPMGWHLAQAGAKLTSLNAAYAPGQAWCCFGQTAADCGRHPLEGKDRGAASFVERAADRSSGWDGVLYVGPITPSLPARGTLAPETLKPTP